LFAVYFLDERIAFIGIVGSVKKANCFGEAVDDERECEADEREREADEREREADEREREADERECEAECPITVEADDIAEELRELGLLLNFFILLYNIETNESDIKKMIT